MIVFQNNRLRHILLLTAILTLIGCQAEKFKGSELPEDIPTTDFTLTDHNGKPFTLSDLKGKVVLMFFGYTFCPDVCPMTLSNWMRIEDTLQQQAEQVEFVYITVDPERDTPQRLKDHLSIYSPNFIGLTGSPEALDSVYSAYGVYRDRSEIEGNEEMYFMSHTSSTLLFDREGRWRLVYSYGTPIEDIVHDIELLLR